MTTDATKYCFFTFHNTAPIVEMLARGERCESACMEALQSRTAKEEWARDSGTGFVRDPKDYVIVRGVSLGTHTRHGAEEFLLEADMMFPAVRVACA